MNMKNSFLLHRSEVSGNVTYVTVQDIFNTSALFKSAFADDTNLNGISLFLLNVMYLTALLSTLPLIETLLFRKSEVVNSSRIDAIYVLRMFLSPVWLSLRCIRNYSSTAPVKWKRCLIMFMTAVIILIVELIFIIGQASYTVHVKGSINDFRGSFGVGPLHGLFMFSSRYPLGDLSTFPVKRHSATSNLEVVSYSKLDLSTSFSLGEEAEDLRNKSFEFIAESDSSFTITGPGRFPSKYNFRLELHNQHGSRWSIHQSTITEKVISKTLDVMNIGVKNCSWRFTPNRSLTGKRISFEYTNSYCPFYDQDLTLTFCSLFGRHLMATARIVFTPSSKIIEEKNLLPPLVNIRSGQDEYTLSKSVQIIPNIVLISMSVTLLTVAVISSLLLPSSGVDGILYLFMLENIGQET